MRHDRVYMKLFRHGHAPGCVWSSNPINGIALLPVDHMIPFAAGKNNNPGNFFYLWTSGASLRNMMKFRFTDSLMQILTIRLIFSSVPLLREGKAGTVKRRCLHSPAG